MQKSTWISLIALLAMVIAIPIYGYREEDRMARAKENLRNEYVQEGIDLYVQNCASCHGADGAGLGMMPPLNNPALAEADEDALFNTIARATHGTAMAAWHVSEGGYLNDYQVNELVALIQHTDWADVETIALKKGFSSPSDPAVESGLEYLSTEDEEDPHQCTDCHEEPALHTELFGINCGRCHNTLAWTPAVLTRHNFALDHGGAGQVDCKTCHPNNYVQYDCYACHEDHQHEEMVTAHNAENIFEFSQCAICHPTGAEDEARQLREQNPEFFPVQPDATAQTNTNTADPGALQLSMDKIGTGIGIP